VRKRQTEGLHSSQKSVRYYEQPEGRGARESRPCPSYDTALYPSMLVEDVWATILPYGRTGGSQPFRVSVHPPNTESEDLIAGGIARREYYRDFAHTVAEFVGRCAQSVIALGEDNYELVYLATADENEVVFFELVSIQPGTLIDRAGKVFQTVPAHVSRELEVPERIELPPDTILRFRLPRDLETEVQKAMDALARLSRHLPVVAWEQGRRPVPLQFGVHVRARKVAIARATRAIGWNARWTLQDQMLEYYYLHRELVFERFKARVRRAIIDTLNTGLERAGNVLGFAARVEIEGLPTEAEIDAAAASLRAGDRSFKEIFEPFPPP